MNIPNGYKLVPVDPTHEMIAALKARITTTSRGGLLACGAALADAIQAAPTPPQPTYDESNAVKEFEAWIPSFWNKEKYQDDEGDWLYSDDLVQGALVGWLACAQSRAKSVEVDHE